MPANSHAFSYDATDTDKVGETFKAIEKQLGPVSVLLENAGGGVFKSAEDATLDFRTGCPALRRVLVRGSLQA